MQRLLKQCLFGTPVLLWTLCLLLNTGDVSLKPLRPGARPRGPQDSGVFTVADTTGDSVALFLSLLSSVCHKSAEPSSYRKVFALRFERREAKGLIIVPESPFRVSTICHSRDSCLRYTGSQRAPAGLRVGCPTWGVKLGGSSYSACLSAVVFPGGILQG